MISIRSNNLSLKHKMFTPSGRKDIGITSIMFLGVKLKVLMRGFDVAMAYQQFHMK